MVRSKLTFLTGKPSFLLTGFISTSLFMSPLQASELQLGIHEVGNWHASNDTQLILEDHQQKQFQATLEPPCKGLSKAKSIAFISNGKNALDQYSKVILPSGKRCAFKSFTARPSQTE